MKSIYYFLCLVFFAGLSSCKKTTAPDESNPVDKQLVKVIVKQNIAGQPDMGKNVFSFTYEGSGRIVKVTQTVTDLPAGSGSWMNGAFDSYEYDGAGRLLKNSMSRFNSSNNIIELTQYDEYAYDAQGLVNKVTFFTKRQGPPDGTSKFRPTGYVVYSYNVQKQMVDQKSYVQINYDINNKEVYELRNIRKYQYEASGNLMKISFFSVYNGVETLDQETQYKSYDTRKNPFYDKVLIVENGLIRFSVNKNHPLDITTTRFSNLPGVANIVSTNKYSVTAQGEDLSSVKEDFVLKNYVGGTDAPTVQTQTGTIDWTFEYVDKP